MSKKIITLLTIILGLNIFTLSLDTAKAVGIESKEEKAETVVYSNEDKIRENLKNEGASDIVIENLINKLKKGEPWDSFKKEYAYIKPQIDTPNYKKTVYPDGSMVITGTRNHNEYELRAVSDLHYANDVQIYKNTIIINGYFTINYVRDSANNMAKITYQSRPIINILDITGNNEPYDLQYGYDYGWHNPAVAWTSFYPMGAIMGEQCWLRGYVNGYGHWIEAEY